MQPVAPGLSHYIHVLRRGLWIVLLTVAIVTGTVVYASLRQAKLYRASADVFLGTQSLASTVSNVPVPSTDPVRQAATQADLARTPTVADQALHLAHLSDRSAVALLSHSTVSAATNADILTFSVTDPRPRVAELLAETYATAYAHYRRQLDTAAIVPARRDVERRLAQLQRLARPEHRGLRQPVRKGPGVEDTPAAPGIQHTPRPFGIGRGSDTAQAPSERRTCRDAWPGAGSRARVPARSAQHARSYGRGGARTPRHAASWSIARALEASAREEPTRDVR